MTPKARRIIGFIDGFNLLHRVGPKFADIRKWEHDSHRCQLEVLLGRLCDQGLIRSKQARYQVLVPLRSKVFVFTPTPDAKTWGTWDEMATDRRRPVEKTVV